MLPHLFTFLEEDMNIQPFVFHKPSVQCLDPVGSLLFNYRRRRYALGTFYVIANFGLSCEM